jgi:hypothetical protein
MSTLKVTNIQSNAAGFNDVVSFQNSSGTENGTLCRAWVNFNGTGVVAIRANFNVSSITDNGTGDYTVNFTNALADTNYSVVSSGSRLIPTIGAPAPVGLREDPTTASVRLAQWYMTATTNQGVIDGFYNNVSIFR